MEWKTIDTAPKDGTAILLCCAGCTPSTGAFDNRLGWVDFNLDDHEAREIWVDSMTTWSPTHWMPLPPPPEVTP